MLRGSLVGFVNRLLKSLLSRIIQVRRIGISIASEERASPIELRNLVAPLMAEAELFPRNTGPPNRQITRRQLRTFPKTSEV
mgnify:CR=1 FL=1